MGYKKIKRQTNITIACGMFLYGFTEEEVSEFADINLTSVKVVYWNHFDKWRVKEIMNLYRRVDRVELDTIQMKSLVFSTNEMDYGYSGRGKYLKEELTGEEKQILKKLDYEKIKLQ